ncbi:MAG: hypothetical protein LBS23_02735 [Holosporaceae bacterium]|jgi:hypothetical protein|nr:hypothetical protein [Holosporaceae bacterium]
MTSKKVKSKLPFLCGVLLIAFLPPFTAREQWLSKIDIAEPTVIRFIFSGTKNSVRVQKIRRLVDNYNLQSYGVLSVSLEIIPDPEEYDAEIKKLAAANELPDVFFLRISPLNQSILHSKRLMDLSSISCDNSTQSYVPEEGKRFLIPVFQEPIVCYYNTPLLSTIGYEKPIFELDEIREILSRSKDKGVYPFALTTLSQSSMSCDLLFAIFQSQTIDEMSLKENWRKCLSVWREIVLYSQNTGRQVFNRTTAVDFWNAGKTAMLIDIDNLFDGNVSSIPLATSDCRKFFEYPLCIAARNVTNENMRKNILDFVVFIQKNLGNIFLPYDSNVTILANRHMNTDEKEAIYYLLEGYLSNENLLDTLAEVLSEFYERASGI